MTNDTETAALTGEVAAVWQRTLNLPAGVAPDADFVSLGGDSLLLMSVINQVEDAYDIEVDLDAVLADLTVPGMVRAILAARGTDAVHAD